MVFEAGQIRRKLFHRNGADVDVLTPQGLCQRMVVAPLGADHQGFEPGPPVDDGRGLVVLLKRVLEALDPCGAACLRLTGSEPVEPNVVLARHHMNPPPHVLRVPA